MREAIIELNGVKKNYGKHSVLSGVNMQVNKGDIYGLIGKNGAGKTTIFKLILGLSELSGGTLSIDGKSSRQEIAAARRKIGFFIGSNFFPGLSARENLKYYSRLKGIKDKNEVERVLKIVELDKATQPFKSFSLGMKQRLGIANALLGQPEILILDEPTNGLDPQGIADIRNLIKQLNKDYDMTIIVSSHILSELQNTADRFGIVNDGVIVKEISTEDLVSEEQTLCISAEDLEKVKASLEAAGVKLQSMKGNNNSLEEVYFDMVGGNKNA